MRRYLQLLLLPVIVTCFFACHKDKQTAPNIVGTWELRQTFGGTTGYATFAPGNGHTYTFNADGSFTQYAGKDTLLNQGSYTIKVGGTQVQGVTYNLLLLNGAQSGPEIQVQDTTMLLGLQYNNEPGGYYAKIK
jgi:hypothetical protein